MSNDVDLSSKEWCDLIFEGKNKDFGAYQLRRTSIQRHNKAMLYTIIGFIVAACLVFAWNAYQRWEAQRQLALQNQQQTQEFSFGASEEESSEEEEKKIEQPKEEEKPEVEEVAQQAVTELKIVPDDKVTTPPPTQDEVKQNDAAISNKNVEGTLGGLTAEIPKETPAPTAKVEQKVAVTVPEEKPKEDDNKVFQSVEQPPQFPGGESALMRYLSSHIQYPAMAAEQGIEGKVILQFVVTKNGQVGEVKVVRSLSSDCDNEAKRVVRSLPRFTPGRQYGNAVNVWYTLPVQFKLQK